MAELRSAGSARSRMSSIAVFITPVRAGHGHIIIISISGCGACMVPYSSAKRHSDKVIE